MKFFDHHPNFFRALISVLAGLFLVIAAINFYRYAGSTTDENWFRDAASRLCFTQGFAAHFDKGIKNLRKGVSPPDSILPGDLLLSIRAGDDLYTFEQVRKAGPADINRFLEENSDDSVISLNILRPALDAGLAYTVSKKALPDSFLCQIPPAVHVFDVFEGGASDRAGMKQGDLIVTINGKGFRNAHQADLILQQAQIGKVIDYEILRGNRKITLHLTLARFGIKLPTLIMLFSGLLFLGVGWFIAFRQPREPALRLLGLALISISFWQLVSYSRDSENDLLVQIRMLLFLASINFSVPLFFHTTFYFPRKLHEIVARKWLIVAFYGIAAFAELVALGVFQYYIPAPLVIFVAIILSCLLFLAVRFYYRKHVPPEYKKIIQPVRYTIAIVTISVIGYFLLLPKFGNAIQRGYAGLALMAIPLMYLYTIGRYRLFNMNLHVRRNIQYTIVSFAWSILVIAGLLYAIGKFSQWQLELPAVRFVGTAIEVLQTPSVQYQEELQKVFLMLVAIGLAYLAYRVGRFGKRLIDERYYQHRYDYRKAANVLADVMSTRLGMGDLAHGIVHKLANLMKLKRVSILFFRREETCCCQEAFGIPQPDWEEVCLIAEKDLPAAVQQLRGEPRFSIDSLPDRLQETMQKHKFRHIVPIRHKSKLVAILLIGEKLSEAPFHEEDLSFLSAVAKQASVAIENSFLYEELAVQERLQHELDIARKIQIASLPQTTPNFENIEIAGISIPATEVGGDYFDYLDGEQKGMMVIVGDVSGKGTSAALYLSKVQGILRSLYAFTASPRELFIRTNQLVYRDFKKKSFFTVLGAQFDVRGHELTLARAGHLPLYHFCAAEQKVHLLTPSGIGIGLEDVEVFSSNLEEKTLAFSPGDVFLFVTDGITEAQNEQAEEFGETQIADLLVNVHAESAAAIRDQLINAVANFSGDAEQHDDQTVVVVKVVG